MGCWYSRAEREEMVSRCRARKRYMKHFVKARQSFSASHSMYLRSLRATGAALLHFATAELRHHHHAPPFPPHAPPNVPMSPTSISWTISTAASTALPPPPPPPPPESEGGSVWGFWDPFMAGSETEEEWEGRGGAGTKIVKKEEDTSGGGGESELAMVVSSSSKDLVEIIKELRDYFYKAAQAGSQVSYLLQVPTSTAKVYGEGKSLSPLMWSFGSCRNMDGFGNCGIGNNNNNYYNYYSTYNENDNGITWSHHSTVEKLYAWEKKLYQEVKNAHILKMEHEKRTAQLRKLELKRSEYIKTEKTKKEVEKLESRMMVATQAIETISGEIIKIRESELYPQLVELVKGLMGMWRSLYEFHQVQTHIVKQLKYINTIPSMDPTSEIHRQSTLQLELEVQQWQLSFCHIIKSQRDYVQSLAGWLRLSLFQFAPLSKTPQDSLIYSLCEEWQLSMDRIPDKVASEGIKTFLTVIHAIVIQQDEEQRQKKKSEAAFRELEKKAGKLRSMESKYGPYSLPENFVKNKNPILVKRAKVEALRTKAEEEKVKHEKAVSVTRAMTMNNLQMGLPHVFDAVTGFANVCIHAYETVYNKAKSVDEFHDVKRLLP